MSRRIGKPVTQVRLTNVAIVRMKHRKKRFEIACYKNKVVNWRNGVESDIGEVLQIDRIFTDVSRGVVAKSKDLQSAFGTTDVEAVCRVILDKGELQVSDKERDAAVSSTYLDVATIVAEKCVNPGTGRPYPVSMIERAMRQVHFNPSTTRTPKQQALEAIGALQEVLPLARAPMRVRITGPVGSAAAVDTFLAARGARVERSAEESGGRVMRVALMDPSHFRELETDAKRECGDACRVEVVAFSVRAAGEDSLSETAIGAEDTDPGPSDVARPLHPHHAPVGRRVVPMTGRAGSTTCRTCAADLDDRDAFRAHFRSDWHRMNLKRKLHAASPLSKDAFDALDTDERAAMYAEFEGVAVEQ